MPGPALTVDQNILPVQAYFNLDGTFNTFIGQGQPFVISATESIGIVNTNVNATLYPTFTSATSGQVTGLAIASPSLTWNPGTGVFSAPTFFGTLNGTANTANNLSGGGAGQIVYQNALGSTAYLAAGSSGQFLLSNGTSAPSWSTVATSVTISDQTTDTATYYPLFYSATSGSTNTVQTSSTKLQYVPSTGTFKATIFSGSGASLTNIPNSALSNSSVTIGSTSIALGATSTTLAGLTSVTATSFVGALNGNANTATTATNATNSAITDNTSSIATWYPTLVSTTSGNQPLNTSSTKLSFVPSTGVLSANGVALTGNLGTVTSVSVASANGFAGTVATSTTTPAITITTSITGILKGDGTAISSAIAADFPTLNQNTTGSAATLTTARAIYGNNFDGSAALTQIIASTYGGTGNGFTKFSGATTAEKTYTLPDANATLLYSGGPLGTPSSGTVTNLTGTASININGTVGATTATTGQFTTGAFGGTQSTAQQLLIGGNSQTASTNEIGIYNNQTVQSAVTSSYTGIESQNGTAAASFTLGTLAQFSAYQGTLGSGSSITTQYGYLANSNINGATNNYGFYGNIAAATGRWNLYMAGTAANYFAGQTAVGTTVLTNGFFSVGGTQSTTASMLFLGGTNTYAGNAFVINIGTTLTGTAASTSLVGIYNPVTFTPATGATIGNAIGTSIVPTLNSTVTPSSYQASNAQLFLGASATGGTISAGYSYISQTPSFNASSTTGFTNFYGYYASNAVGTANNAIGSAFGFYSNQASSNTGVTNNWNFYAGGTAPNYFAGDMRFNKTVTATGTTGAQTISKNAGTVNFAAAATSLVVTNTLVTTSSIIICTVGTNDTTMKSVSAVAAAGSFTLYANAAATAETRVNFIVIN